MNSRKLLVGSLVIVVALALALSGLALARSSKDKAAAIVVSGVDVPNSGKFTTLQVLNGQQQMGLSISGTGEVSVTPDISVVSLGVEAEAKTVADAQKQASDAMNAVMSALTANGIADKDIQTTNFSIQPIWDYNTDKDGISKRTLNVYQVSNMVNVTIRGIDKDMTKVGSIIDAVAEAGGDLARINNISFTVDNAKPYNDQARELAIKDAMAKAKQMANVAGVSLGKLLYITESSNYSGPIRLSVASDSGSSTPISSGQLDISLSVQMVYAIE